MKKFSFLTAILILLMAFAPMVGAASENEYVIDGYNVVIEVGTDNVYTISETITADFFVQKHGIFREIPMDFGRYRTRIYDVYVNEQFSQSKSNGMIVLKIGDPDYTLTGRKEYVIRYKMSLGEDINPEFDLFYYNIIGTGWDTIVKNVKFEIKLPVSVSEDKIDFYIGSEGSNVPDSVYYEISGATIKGSVPILGSYEGVTAYIELPGDTFLDAEPGQKASLYSLVAWLFCIGLVFFAFMIWQRKGKDPMIYPSVQFKPPEEMTPAEVGYVIDGVVDDKDITSLIFYWADKGYLDITESGKNEYLFIKKNDPPPKESYETFMFHRLFEYGRDGWVSTNDLDKEFYEDLPLIKEQIKDKFQGNKRLFTKESQVWSGILLVMAVIPCLVLILVMTEGYFDMFSLFPVLFALVGVIFSGAVIVNTLKKWNLFTRGGKFLRSIFFGLFVLVFCFITFGFAYAIEEGMSPVYHSDVFIFMEALRTTLSIAAIFILSAATIKRTEYGHSMLEHLLGLKEFIRDAEMDKLKQMIEDNPDYFYDILPYAIVLGLENKWAGKFSRITMAPPSYYRTSGDMSVGNVFTASILLRCIGRTGHVMTVAKSSGSGGFSGGGFSGGGAGGGGGGSW
ncbi:MAG: DUF2207 domain-containing protein [Clostridia bacterium]|nr:DUF2207 domain-containing protein [Clostridia bacterium]